MKRRNFHRGKASVAVLLLAVVVWTAVAPTQAAADRDINILIGSTSTLGSSLDASELRQLLKGEEEIDAQELADFSADKVVFSDIRLLVDDVELPDGTTMSQTVHYRDVELKDVVDGIAGSLTIGSTTTETPTLTLQAGELTMEDFNVPAVLAFYGMVDAADADDMATLVSGGHQGGFNFETDDGMSCTGKGMDFGATEARPLEFSFHDLIADIASDAGDDGDDAEELSGLLKLIAEFSSAVRMEESVIHGLHCFMADAADDEPEGFTLDELRIGAFDGPVLPAFELHDFALLTTAGSDATAFSFDNLTVKPIDYSAPLAALQQAGDALDEQWLDEHKRELVPEPQGLSLKNLVVSMPAAPGELVTGTDASLDEFDLTLADYVDGAPTTLTARIDRLSIDLPEELPGDLGAQLEALGVDRLVADSQLALDWNQADEIFTLDKLALDLQRLGAVDLSAELGNVSTNLISGDAGKALTSAMGLTVNQLQIGLADHGAGNVLFNILAEQSDSSVEQQRTTIAGMVQAMISGMLGSAEDISALAEDVGTFIREDGHQLSITLTAREGDSVPALALMQLRDDPGKLSELFHIKTVLE